MCGIAGIYDLKGERPIDVAALKRMSEALTHRGPDGEGLFFKPGVGFAHQRLAIIDIEGGHQPFETKEGALTYNGEVYNYEKLADELRRKGTILKTRSDTEVLAQGLGNEGARYLQHLRGMFAFAFYDRRTKSVILARDRLGEKPLYYAQTSDGFLIFASEIGALIESRLIEKDIAPEAVSDYFFYGYVPDPKTIYKNIYKLPPAHTLQVTHGQKIECARYWRPVFAPSGGLGFDNATQMLTEKIDDAVRSQMISDVPLGAFLSGGVDSAGIVSSMARTGNDVIACTIGFSENTHDERDGAREIASRFEATHHEHVASIDTDNLIDKVAMAYGEPFADSSALASYIVSELARKHVTVALSGDGGDEIFAGYRRYPFFLREEKLRSAIPSVIRSGFFGPAGAIYPKLDWAPKFLRAKTTLQSLGTTQADAYAQAVAINLPHRAHRLLSRDLKEKLNGYRPHSVIENVMAKANSDDPLARAQYADLMTWLPGRMLTKVDRASMAHGLEVRPPLLDHRLVEWSGLLPSQFKVSGLERKRILKAAMTERLGESYVQRPKRGFDMPVSDWLRRPDSPLIKRLNSATAWRQSGLIDEKYVQALVKDHQRGTKNCGQELWSVIMFDAFLQAN